MRYAAVGLLVTLLALTSALPAPLPDPRPPEEPLADKVKKAIERDVDFLVSARVMNGNELTGWTYGFRGVPDNSNTQYALLGLHEGFVAGADVKPEVWEGILEYYKSTQRKGAWGYRRNQDPTT